MPLTENQKNLLKTRIKSILKLDERIEEKQADILNGDTSPFLLELFGYERTLFVKVGQSIQTTMGMSFYEQTCKILGEQVNYKVDLQKKAQGYISEEIEQYLQMLNRNDYKPNRTKEFSEIRKMSKNVQTAKENLVTEYPDSTVDVYITTPEGKEILIDITTVKPNKKEFRILKEKTLRWASYRLTQNPNLEIETFFAIPYNPESSDEKGTIYERFNEYYDRKDLLVGDELWKKVSGNQCSIEDIKNIFKDLGTELQTEINKSFERIL